MRIFTLLLALLLTACQPPPGNPGQEPPQNATAPPVVLVEGGGSGFVELLVLGLPLSVKIDALALQDDGVEFCPVFAISFAGGAWKGTHAGAAEACRTRYGVLGLAPAPRVAPEPTETPF